MGAAELHSGEMLLQYRLIERIGSGGMGDVWKAVDTRLHREVALKLIDADHVADPERRRRLLQEARLAAALNHANTVTIYDVHTGDPFDFIAMEYVQGVTLHQALRRGRMSLEQTLGCAVQVADALGAAHAAGIVHRDLKPANIMLAADGRARVLDFGLARGSAAAPPDDLTESGPLTRPGTVMGTPAYMSPEQALGEEIDARSDVFSFGIVLYEMLAGVSPFHGESRSEVLRKLLRDDPASLTQAALAVPAELNAIVCRCLDKDPARRYANCAEVCAALRQVAARLSAISGAETVALEPARRPRSSALPWLAGAIALLAVLGWGWSRLAAPRQRGVAVLPFTSVGGDSRTQAFGLGLVMAVSTHLAGLDSFQRAFWVASPSDVLQAHTQSARDARQWFGVDLVVAGSIEVMGDRIRVTANLTDAHTQRQLRSRQITTGSTDSLLLEDQMVQVVSELLEVELPAAERTAARASGPGAEDFYLQGRGYLQAGDQSENAVAALQEALRRDPQSARAQAALCVAYLQRFDRTKDPQWLALARSAGDAAVRSGGRTPESLTSLAMVAREDGRYDQSVVLLREVLRAEPLSAEAWTALARAYEPLKRPKEAEAAYRQAVALHPGNPSAYRNLGIFFYKQGRYDDARRNFERERDLAPDNYRCWYLLGALYLQTGRAAEAETVLKRSLELKPNGPAYNNLAALYFNQERYADAVPMMEHAVEMGPVSMPLLMNLARAYRYVPALAHKAGPVEERARQLAATLLEINPRDPEVHADLGLLMAETGDGAGAIRELEAARSLAPANPTVLFRAVMAYEALGRRDDALAAYRALAATGTFLEEVERRPDLKGLRSDPRFRGGK